MGDHKSRVFTSDGAGNDIVAVGLRQSFTKDLYHLLLTISWARLFLVVVVGFLVSNAIFAAGYLALGDGIENARRGSFADAFFFSVQTMATIGYGKLAPATTAANLLVALEALAGLLGLAVVTGLVFAKFSRPTARVLFSNVAVVAPYERVSSLMFRMANQRANRIVEAHLKATIVRNETTAEGEPVRRMHDLALLRSESAFFALTWTAIHPITEDSPLHGEDAASMEASETDIVVSLTGFDESFSQTIHARHAYRPDQVLWNVRFRDIISKLPNGLRAVDYRKFHDVIPLELGKAERTPGTGRTQAGERGADRPTWERA